MTVKHVYVHATNPFNRRERLFVKQIRLHRKKKLGHFAEALNNEIAKIVLSKPDGYYRDWVLSVCGVEVARDNRPDVMPWFARLSATDLEDLFKGVANLEVVQ